MSQRSNTRSISSCEDTCAVCSDRIEIFAVGLCDHPICFKCSTRMRVFCEQMYCAICRADLPKVAFIEKCHSFEKLVIQHFSVYRKNKIYFENDRVNSTFYKLLEHRCKECPEKTSFKTWPSLRDHMRREHDRYYCDICVAHIKTFSSDRKYYDRKKLAVHRRLGDEDDTSHKGHPLCEFCDERYLDKDELAKHLRKDHFFCHFCDADGYTNEYFKEYDALQEHFQESHYLCLEGDCLTARFTHAFKSEIDLKAHRAHEHAKGMKKGQVKQARTIEIDFNIAPRPGVSRRARGARGGPRSQGVITPDDFMEVNQYDRQQDSRGNRGARARAERDRRDRMRLEEETARALAASLNERPNKVNTVDPSLLNPPLHNAAAENGPSRYDGRSKDFPTLDGEILLSPPIVEEDKTSLVASEREHDASARDSLAKKVHINADTGFNEADFPTLGKGGASIARPNKENRKPEEDFPTLGASLGRPRAMPQRQMPQSSWTKTPSATAPKVRAHIPRTNNSKPGVSASLQDYPTLAYTKPNANVQSNPPKQKLPPGLSLSTKEEKNKTPSPKVVQKSKAQKQDSSKTSEPTPGKDAAQSWSKGSEPFQTVGKTTASKKGAKVEDDYPALAKPAKKMQQTSPKAKKKNVAKFERDFPTLGAQPEDHEKSQSLGQARNAIQAICNNSAPSVRPDEPFQVVGKSGVTPSMGGKSTPDNDLSALGKASKFAVLEGKPEQPSPKTKKKDRNKLEDEFPTLGGKATKVVSSASTHWGPKSKESVEEAKTTKDDHQLVTTKLKKNKRKSKVHESASQDSDRFSDAKTKSSDFNSSDLVVEDISPTDSMSSGDGNFTTKNHFVPKQETKLLEESAFTSLVEDLSMNEFPTLSSAPPGIATVSPPPGVGPPGFAKAKPPPPGFVSSKISHTPPPGFTPASVPETNGTAIVTPNVFVQPSDFNNRNANLIKNIQDLVNHDSVKFQAFKSSSVQFRQGAISGKEYYNQCSNIIGHEKFRTIFPELCVLLPDLDKQQELLVTYRQASRTMKANQKKSSAWSKSNVDLEVCPVCSQVLISADYMKHVATHNFDNNFPSLGS